MQKDANYFQTTEGREKINRALKDHIVKQRQVEFNQIDIKKEF